MDTIFALSSGQPPAAIGIIRISGAQAGAALQAMAGRLPQTRRATLATIRDPSNGEVLDRALILWFQAPATSTGEDLAEIHCHGGRGVTAAILRVLSAQPDCRMAEAGEFTRRAFENGRIDLNEAEGLADLLFAETETQRRAAMAMAQGHFSQLLTNWQSTLLHLSALTEASLDFSDEDDVPDQEVEGIILHGIRVLTEEVLLEQARPSAERLRDGIRVVLAGPPNAGKSTLLNALVGRDAAIVSDIEGTTRDCIDVSVAFHGTPFLITDTAGLRGTEDHVEALGIGKAEQAIREADILLWLGPSTRAPRSDAVIIAAKSDLPGWRLDTHAHLGLSVTTGKGMEALISELLSRASHMIPHEGEYALHKRQRDSLEQFGAVLKLMDQERDMLIVAEHLRHARKIIDRLTGRAGTEDMLDALFGGFCIGK